ncbi:unnamed protein product [Trifolium pratense]|uniref:Uncharacterized protein n=1 Tax=Trifolium pratense TaxID=57577 RepID=A0ACB0JK01_TRIPR|nr:unnamed protein product [Trifolium pratense]
MDVCKILDDKLSAFIEQSAIPHINEELGASFSCSSVRGYKHGLFVSERISQKFRTVGESFLHKPQGTQYIDIKDGSKLCLECLDYHGY